MGAIYKTEDYLKENYLTLTAVEQLSGVPAYYIIKLISTQCVPPHSYEIRKMMTVKTSNLCEYTAPVIVIRYYHKDLPDWIR